MKKALFLAATALVPALTFAQPATPVDVKNIVELELLTTSEAYERFQEGQVVVGVVHLENRDVGELSVSEGAQLGLNIDVIGRDTSGCAAERGEKCRAVVVGEVNAAIVALARDVPP